MTGKKIISTACALSELGINQRCNYISYNKFGTTRINTEPCDCFVDQHDTDKGVAGAATRPAWLAVFVPWWHMTMKTHEGPFSIAGPLWCGAPCRACWVFLLCQGTVLQSLYVFFLWTQIKQSNRRVPSSLLLLCTEILLVRVAWTSFIAQVSYALICSYFLVNDGTNSTLVSEIRWIAAQLTDPENQFSLFLNFLGFQNYRNTVYLSDTTLHNRLRHWKLSEWMDAWMSDETYP